jgi:hypothetical protein
MAVLGFLFLALAVTQGALAPFERCQESANDGMYIVLFHTEVAPNCTTPEAVEKWLFPVIGSAKVHFAWSFGNFRGFSVSLSEDQISLLRQESAVKRVEENCIVRLADHTVHGPVETSVADLPGWGQYRSDQNTTGYSTTITFKPPTTAASTGTANARTVHILDTGVRTTHDEFKTVTGGASRVVTAVTFTADGTADGNGHGTHVAGTCCGVNAGYDVWATLVSVKVLNNQGSGTNQGIINGINYVVNNKRVGTNFISMSLGGTGTVNSTLNQAVNSAFASGVNSIVAAGNGDATGKGIPANDTNPCNALDSICVASCGSTTAFSSFSNYGYYVDIIAPGENIKSAWYTADNAYNTISGTSMATPAVTGVSSVTAYVSPTKATTANLRGTLVTCSNKGVVTGLSTKPLTDNYLLYDKC